MPLKLQMSIPLASPNVTIRQNLEHIRSDNGPEGKVLIEFWRKEYNEGRDGSFRVEMGNPRVMVLVLVSIYVAQS